MTNSQQAKFDYELATCNTFLSLYSSDVSFLRHGDPLLNEPDCICSNGIGIEVVGIYDDENQAKDMWNKGLVNKDRQDDFDLYSFENLYKKIEGKLSKLNDGLYDGFSGKKILLCDMLSPLLTTKDIKKYIELYVSFRSECKFMLYFEEVWILWKPLNMNSYRINRLE